MLDDGPVTERPGDPRPPLGTPVAPGAGPDRAPGTRPDDLWGADGPSLDAAWPEPEPTLTPRAVTLAVATVVTALLVGALSLVSLPYVANLPGPTFDTLGRHDDVDLIEVVGAPTYPSEGELRFTTVRLRGGVGRALSVYSLVNGWLDGSVTVVPVEQVFPPDQTAEEIDERNQAAMITSQETASVAALEELGYEVATTLRVDTAVEGTGAFGVVDEGDVLLAVDGRRVAGFAELTEVMDAVTPGETVTLTLEREGDEQDVEVVTADDGTGRALIGVLIDPEFDLPVDVRIQIDDVGGPSAGLMFSLGIISTLTEADETGGEPIAGTGTMDLTGEVGPIGGIVQKMVGARDDGAAWFLAPTANCGEVVGNVPDGLRVVAVGTLHDAREAVEDIGAGRGASLPTCEAAVG